MRASERWDDTSIVMQIEEEGEMCPLHYSLCPNVWSVMCFIRSFLCSDVDVEHESFCWGGDLQEKWISVWNLEYSSCFVPPGWDDRIILIIHMLFCFTPGEICILRLIHFLPSHLPLAKFYENGWNCLWLCYSYWMLRVSKKRFWGVNMFSY